MTEQNPPMPEALAKQRDDIVNLYALQLVEANANLENLKSMKWEHWLCARKNGFLDGFNWGHVEMQKREEKMVWAMQFALAGTHTSGAVGDKCETTLKELGLV